MRQITFDSFNYFRCNSQSLAHTLIVIQSHEKDVNPFVRFCANLAPLRLLVLILRTRKQICRKKFKFMLARNDLRRQIDFELLRAFTFIETFCEIMAMR